MAGIAGEHERSFRQNLVNEIQYELRGIKSALEDLSPVEYERDNGTMSFTTDDVYSLWQASRRLDEMQSRTNGRLVFGSTLGLLGGATALAALGPLAGVAGVMYLSCGTSVIGGGINFFSSRSQNRQQEKIFQNIANVLQRFCNITNSFNILINGVRNLEDALSVARHSTHLTTEALQSLRIQTQSVRQGLQFAQKNEFGLILRAAVEIFEAFQTLLEMCNIHYDALKQILKVLKFLQGCGTVTLESLRCLMPIAATWKVTTAEKNLQVAKAAEALAKVEQETLKISRDIVRISGDTFEMSTDVVEITKKTFEITKDVGKMGKETIQRTTDVAKLGKDTIEMTTDVAKIGKETLEVTSDVASIGKGAAEGTDEIAKLASQCKYARYFSGGVAIAGICMDAYTLYSAVENMSEGSRSKFSRELQELAGIIQLIISLNL